MTTKVPFSELVSLMQQDAKMRGAEAYLQRGRPFKTLEIAELNAAFIAAARSFAEDATAGRL